MTSRAHSSRKPLAARKWLRAVGWVLAVVAFLAASAYVIGGPDVLRQVIRRSREMRTQAVAALQPPTTAEMQRAAADTQSAITLPQRGKPVSLGVVLGSVVSVVGGAVLMFYLTGRRRERRD